MAAKFESILKGKLNVEVPDSYEVYEKGYPQSLKDSEDYTRYDWIGNFGFREISSKKNVEGLMPRSYEIQAGERSNKDLVYWDGKKTVKFEDAKVKEVGNKNVRSAKLKMGDPPVGWAK
jgi:hypothetical protein